MNYKNKKKYFILISFVLVISFLLVNISLAAKELPDPLKLKGEDAVPALAGNIIKTILGMVGVLALIMFIYGGILWMTSGGSAEKIKKGKDTIVWAVFGLAFIFFSYAILDFILKALMNE